MMKNNIALIYLCLLISISISAQSVMTIEDAIQIALENNYQVQIARNNERISANQNTAGNAGFLPTASIFGNVNYSSNNTTQRFFSGDEQMRTGAGNTVVRAGAVINWTAFDGFLMYATKNRLELTEEKSKEATRSEMHDLVYRVQTSYQDLIRINQQMDNVVASIELNQALRTLTNQKLNLGASTKLEVLQSINRIKSDSAQLLNFQNQFELVKIGFNQLLNRDADTNFEVPSTFDLEIIPNIEISEERAIQENYALSLLSYDEQIVLAQIKEARAQLYPTLDLNLGYNYNWSKSEAGFLLSNRTFGPQIGISANYDIFTGRDLKKEINNVELLKENILLSREQLTLEIKSQLASLYQNYRSLEEVKILENSNLKTAEENTQLAQDLYRSGRATNFDVREAILNETLIKDRLSEVTYGQKLVELEIRYISGSTLQ